MKRPRPDLAVAEHHGRYLLHAPLHQVSCLINRSMFERLRCLLGDATDTGEETTEVLAELAACGLDQLRSPEAISSATRPYPSDLSLLLTERCNLQCRYCYARGGDGANTLDLAAGRAALRLVVANAVRAGSPEVTLHLHGGGEVSLVWDLARRLVDHARDLAAPHQLALRLSAGTNGVMAAARAREMAELLDEATVSIDGLPAVHNHNRPLRDGRPTFATVLRTLELFADNGLAHGLRLTVTPDDVDRLAEGVALLCRRTASQVLQVEPAYPLGRWRDRGAGLVDATRFVAAFRDARAVAAEHRRELRFSAARYPRVSDIFCQAVSGALCLTPGGKVTTCYEAGEDPDGSFTVGHYDGTRDRLVIDEVRRRRLLDLSVEHRPACDGCIARYHCAGDCPMKRRGGAAAVRCQITRTLTKDQILAELEGDP